MTAIQKYGNHGFGSNHEQLGIDHHTYAWVTRDSPTTEIVGGSQPDKHSIIAWGPGHHYSARRTVVLWKIWPRAQNGANNRILNFHSTPALPGSWFWGGGVSPLALDYCPTDQVDDKDASVHFSGLTLVAEPQGAGIESGGHRYHWSFISMAQWAAAVSAGTPFDITMDIRWGHVSLATKGRVYIYLNGNNTPVVDTGDICTHYLNDYRDDGSGNVPPKPSGGQQGITLWTGNYSPGSNAFSAVEINSYDFTMPRLGVDPAEAQADGRDWSITDYNHGGQESVADGGGGHSHNDILSPDDTSTFRLPSIFGGGGGGTPPPPPPPTTLPSGIAGWGDVTDAPSGNPLAYGFNNKRGAKYVAPDTRDIIAVWVQQAALGVSGGGGSINERLILSASDLGSPALPLGTLATLTPFNIPAGMPAGLIRCVLPGAPYRLTQGTEFFLSVQTDLAVGDAQIMGYHIEGAPGRFVFTPDAYADGPSDPWGTPTDTQVRRLWAFFEGALVAGGPANTVLPAITGSKIIGQVLTSSTGTWTGSPTSYTYQWQRDDQGIGAFSDIPGATSSTYTLTAADLHCNHKVKVTAINASGSAQVTSASTGTVVTGVVNLTPPTIIGGSTQVHIGDVLTGDDGTWTAHGNLTFTRQWLRGRPESGIAYAPISGATGQTYTVVEADAGLRIQFRVTANDGL